MPGQTIHLHRLVRSTPERIYPAFLDTDALATWLPPNGLTGKVHQLDAKVGGVYQIGRTGPAGEIFTWHRKARQPLIDLKGYCFRSRAKGFVAPGGR